MSENYSTGINQLFQFNPRRKSQPEKPGPEQEKLLFPTPEMCPDPMNSRGNPLILKKCFALSHHLQSYQNNVYIKNFCIPENML